MRPTGPAAIPRHVRTGGQENRSVVDPSSVTPFLGKSPIGLVSALAAVLLALPGAAAAATASNSTQFSVNPGSMAFYTAPTMPTFPSVTLNGQAQTDNASMNAFAVIDATGTGLGWNVIVNGNSGTGTSPVFAQYCPNATCGTDTGPGYVSGGASLPAGSLTLNTTSGLISGLLGTLGLGPTFGSSCSSGCALDVSSS